MTRNSTAIKPSQWAFRIFVGTWLAEIGFYFCRRNISPASLPHEIVQPQWLGSFANIIFFFSAGYAAGNVTGGWLADRFGARTTLLVGGILSAISTALIATAPSAAAVVALQLLNGFGQGFGWPSINKLFSVWLEPRQAPMAIALWSTCYTLGGYLGAAFPTVLGLLRLPNPAYGHAVLFLAPALVLLATTRLCYQKVRNSPQELGIHLSLWDPSEKSAKMDSGDQSHSSWKLIVGNSEVRLLVGMYFFLKMTRYALLFWLPIYLVEIHRDSRQPILSAASLFETAGFIGTLMAASLVQRTGKLYQVCAGMLFLAFFALLFQPVAGLLGATVTAAFVALLGILIYGPEMLLTSVAVFRAVPPSQVGRATGLINAVGSLGQMVSSFLVLTVAHEFGWNSIFNLLALTSFIPACMLTSRWESDINLELSLTV